MAHDLCARLRIVSIDPQQHLMMREEAFLLLVNVDSLWNPSPNRRVIVFILGDRDGIILCAPPSANLKVLGNVGMDTYELGSR